MVTNQKTFGWASDWYAKKRVLVVGGSSGIGAAIAHGFLEAGALVMVTGVSEAQLDGLAEDERLRGTDRIAMDVRDEQAVKRLFDQFNSLDVLVNCAGVIKRGDELDPVTFADVVDVNLNGTMRCCAAARPALAQSGAGAILNLASMLSYFGGGVVPGYAASKGGIAQLTRSLAIAYSVDDIRVNAIAPGWIETPLTGALREDRMRSEAILARTPLGRWGRPEDISGAALFLCSPAASFVTGAILNVDGGYAAA